MILGISTVIVILVLNIDLYTSPVYDTNAEIYRMCEQQKIKVDLDTSNIAPAACNQRTCCKIKSF